jgi:hypothetical protein
MDCAILRGGRDRISVLASSITIAESLFELDDQVVKTCNRLFIGIIDEGESSWTVREG